MAYDTLTITDNRTGKQYEMPVTDGTIKAMDLRQIKVTARRLRADDVRPGVQNTAACRSAITYIDGDKGILLYRGYPIEQLAEHSTFLETAYLILFGELPTTGQLQHWTNEVTLHTMVHENIKKFMEGFPTTPIRWASSSARSAPSPPSIPTPRRSSTRSRAGADRAADRQGPDHRRLRLPPQHRPAVRLPGQRPELHRQLPEHAVQDDRAQVPAAPGARARARRAVHPARRPRTELQHERDAGIGSSHVDPYSALAGAAAALYGPLHGGANEAVLRMLDEIGSVANVPAFIKKVKAGEGRLMGFGHRVYKSYDPRAKIIKKIADEVFAVTGRNPLLDIALELERIALEDDYFVSASSTRTSTSTRA
jgi:citrate synthase